MFIRLFWMCLLVPMVGRAQYRFAPGRYTLTNGRSIEGVFKLDVNRISGGRLYQRVDSTHQRRIQLRDVASATLAGRRFLVLEKFRAGVGINEHEVARDLVEVAETGSVELLRYTFTSYHPSAASGPFQYSRSYYARPGGTEALLPYFTRGTEPFWADNTDFAELFPRWPALQARLLLGTVAPDSLAHYVRRYNNSL
ncbi:hypothetical protein EJV47_18405 [Hymenobacter gummosus]|uniref:Uncharacterized protein n=1 Tax=Hymenobacter gummosus TaxID=1776032 RepID=A0A431U0E6_9BACT|nr:hypothetical protein [Hymenobacter gummosus]RTQ47891.1 hypothetical protein EJV47_18405 [Hymenobacter gummosus]